ncbi:MAG: hypothetical protein K9L61_03045 [Candidatus Omnitrophica bacterium]|nr:hypothetical protein [Candidatus Omnitrophota bacterium]
MSETKKPTVAAVLSLMPGLSHLYLGQIKKALVLFVIDLGLGLILVFSQSYLMKLIMINIYLFTFIPACIETYSYSKGNKSRISTDSRWYVTILLITTGFNALPLLWQSNKLTKRYKIIWTVLVPILAAAFVFILIRYWDNLEAFLKSII